MSDPPESSPDLITPVLNDPGGRQLIVNVGHALVEDGKTETLRSVLRKGSKAEADHDIADMASLIRREPMAAHVNQGSSSSSSYDAKADIDEDKKAQLQDETEDKAMRAAALQKKREAAAKNPLVQKQKWLNGINELLLKLKGKAEIARAAVKIPNNMNTTYADGFDASYASLVKLRSWLEDPQERNVETLKRRLKDGNTQVLAVKKEMDAYNSVHRTYMKEKAPKT